jgi:ABC-type glycerol-3-phosphate transport system substrate-binding protein
MKTKRIISLLTAAALSLTLLSGCGEPPAASKDNIFTAESFYQGAGDFDNIGNMIFDGTHAYFIANKYIDGSIEEVPADDNSEIAETPPVEVLPIPRAAIVKPVAGIAEEKLTAKAATFAEDVIVDVAEEVVEDTPAVTESEQEYTDTNETVVASEVYTYDNYSYLVKMDLDGSIIKQTTLFHQDETTEGYTNYSNLSLGSDGMMYSFCNVSDYHVDDDGNYTDSNEYSIVKFDKELNQTVAIDLSAVILPLLPPENQYIWVDYFTIDGNIAYMVIQNALYAVDMNTKSVIINKTLKDDGSEYIQGLYVLPDGTLRAIMTYYHVDEITQIYSSKVMLVTVNRTNGDFGDEIDFPFSYNILPGDESFDFYAYDNVGVYGIKASDGSATLLVNILASGMGDISIANLTPISSERFITSGYPLVYTERGGVALYLLDKVDPTTIPDKALVTVASLQYDYHAVNAIREFNKASTLYQVDYKDYSNSGNIDIKTVLTTFNNDIIAGNIPDIVLITTDLPYDSYVSKGLFMDLTDLLSKDTDLPLDSFYPAIIKALRTEDNKLYSIASGFSVKSLVGKASLFSNESPGISFEELSNIAVIGGKQLFRADTTRHQLLNNFIFNIMGNYIDSDTGTCHFDTPEFITLLETIKSYPENIDYENFDWQAANNALKDGTALLDFMQLYDFRNLKTSELSMFGEDAKFLGFPGSEGETGITAYLTGEAAIMSKTRNPDGAWEFLKSYMVFKDPNNVGSPSYMSPDGALSVFTSDLEGMAAEAKENPYYFDYQTKEKVYYDNIVWFDDGEVTVPNNTDADNKRIFDLIDGISNIAREENELQTILSEDITAFFDGQKTASEAAAIIQDRASTFIAESR